MTMVKMQKDNFFIGKRTPLLIIVCLLILFMGIAQAFASANCAKRYPNPRIKFDRQDAQGRVYIPVVNRGAYDNEMFRAAPELPPCGGNTNSSRTWVDIYDAATNARLYGFCALNSKDDLKGLWFLPTTPSGRAYIIINDRACKKTYKSNTITWGPQDNCKKRYPNPKIKFDRQDAQGRVYIPVLNWGSYDNEMFRVAPELPPCGLNSNSSRTWVDIYDAATNARLYGFCGLNSNDDLKGIWFLPTTPSGRAYIIINDRACKKTYKSNTITWGPQDNCKKRYPNPKIKFDRQDAQGRVYIPVLNWGSYDNEMFRVAPELPPCGLNSNSSRTWVDIYNAATNAKIYGFCGLNSNDDLKSIWFKPSTPHGLVYIIINDRACKKSYKSNRIKF